MDIVLEALDTYVFDHIYARAFPTESVKAHPILTKLAGDLTSSFNATEELPLTNAWTYKPATTYFTLEPSMSAYTSAFARDNIFRQSISLFLITWYACLSHRIASYCIGLFRLSISRLTARTGSLAS